MTEDQEAAISGAHERISALEAKVESLAAKLKQHGIHTEEPTAATNRADAGADTQNHQTQ